ncbi:hypothetical protein MRX96_016196 [Rhipicephalus microplus]
MEQTTSLLRERGRASAHKRPARYGHNARSSHFSAKACFSLFGGEVWGAGDRREREKLECKNLKIEEEEREGKKRRAPPAGHVTREETRRRRLGPQSEPPRQFARARACLRPSESSSSSTSAIPPLLPRLRCARRPRSAARRHGPPSSLLLRVAGADFSADSSSTLVRRSVHTLCQPLRSRRAQPTPEHVDARPDASSTVSDG